MSKLTNLFEEFRDYQARKVDNPNYTPLRQPILEQTPTKEEVRKAKRRDYMRSYYEEHREKIREYNREYQRKYSNKLPQKYGLKGIQLRVYHYMVEQYQLWGRVPRGTQIAKALDVGEQTVYNAVFALVKKGLVGRGQIGKYYLINPPIKEKDEIEKELEVRGEGTNDIGLIAEQPSDNGYIDSLAGIFNSGLVAQNKELYEENHKLKETLRKIREAWMKHEDRFDEFEKAWNQSYEDLDQIIMDR